MKLTSSKTLKFSISGFRGIYGKDITPENIPKLCSAFNNSISKGLIAIARDTRNTGEAMRQLTLGSLLSSGREVIDLGILPTPTLKNYIATNNLSGGLMISASHNPPEYNAFKFIKKGGSFFDEKDNQKFLNHLKENLTWENYKKHGKLRQANQDAINSHIQCIISNIKLPKKIKMKIAIDTLGACATNIAKIFLEKIGAQVFSMYPTFLEKFPREPEPKPQALTLFASFVKKNGCDIGFAFDPDADRLAVVSSSGEILGEELTLPLAALEALNYRDGGMIVNLSSSWLNQWVAERFDKKIYRSKVGESHVVHLIKKTRSKFGGEGNGGVIDMEIPSQGRDSIAGMAWIIALMYRKNQSLDHIVREIPTTFMKKVTISLQDKLFLDEIKSKILQALPEFQLKTEDGIHLAAKTGLPWLHIRASNTEPVIRVIAEAESSKQLHKILSLLERSKLQKKK